MFKSDFPIFEKTGITYLDTAASSQKPRIVLETMDDFYRTGYANVHRGQCSLAVGATNAYEQARATVADFLGADSKNIIFTKGATESINLVANGYEHLLQAGDEVLISVAEHHANFVPWQQICNRSGATLRIFNVLPSGQWDMDDFRSKLSPKTRLVAVAQMSNVLGLINPIQKVIQQSHEVGAKVLIDGAQGIAHIPTNVRDLDCDFYAFSGHKIYGPTGIGVLYGKTEVLEMLPPYQFGGDMIKTVSVDKTIFADIPARFEAGTTPFVEAIGLSKALQYVSQIGREKIIEYEETLTEKLIAELLTVKGVELMGSDTHKTGLVSFNIKGVHPADLAFVLAKENICVRVGHHCAMPVHQVLGQEISLRVSLGVYNDEDDIAHFMKSLGKALSLLGED